MGVLRKMCIEEYATPPQLAKMVGDSRYLPMLIAFPVLLLLMLGSWAECRHGEVVPPGHTIPEGHHRYSKLFPTLLVDFIFVPAFFFAVGVLALGVMRYWKDLNAN